MKFTDRQIQSLKTKEKRYIVWKDSGEGLGIRVSAKGKKTFIFMYRFEGKNRMLSLGEYPATTLSRANIEHRAAKELLDKGIDPGAEKQKEIKAEKMAETFEELADDYLIKWAMVRKRSWRVDKRMLAKDVLPYWKDKKAKDIKRRDVVVILERIVARGSLISANRTFALIRKVFKYAVSKDIVEYSPCAGVVAPSQENQRDRVLDDDEITKLWHNLEEANMEVGSKLALKLMLVTGQRSGEVLGIELNEIDLQEGWWVIPAEKAKNKLAHRVPLPSLAIAIIKESIASQPAGRQSNKYLYPSPKEGQHIHVTAMSYALRRSKEILGVDNFTPHDLRRSAASHMTSMGIPRFTVSKILNHAEAGVTKVYDRYSYDREKREALDKWAGKLENILKERA